VDLIFAAPGLSTEDWRADLGQVLSLAPDHLSAYNLAFEEGTQFLAWLQAGRIARQPEEVELEQFHATRELSRHAQMEAYEVSNFSSNGNLCSHNLNYWENGDYVGIGPSAASHVAGVRSGNARSLAAYLRGVNERGDASDWSERLDPRARLGETWWLGLRLARGVDPEDARRREAFDGFDPLVPTARALCERGLLLEREGRFALTDEGLPVADAVAREFLA
jgi:oxygen-independent coproporphyrinogen-3 oxidase